MSKDTNVANIIKLAQKPMPTNKTGGGSGKGSGKAIEFGDYLIKNGMFYQVKSVKSLQNGNGTIEFALCDFTCRIMEEVIADDGLSDTTFLRIEGRRFDGVRLPLVDVPSKSFYSGQGSWANDHWGTLPVVYPGPAKKENLKTCIQLYSRLDGDVPRCTVYRYTGWKNINDQWHYLTGNGAINADGLVNSVQVDLGVGHMSRYSLPPPLVGDSLNKAASDALMLLDICPKKPHIGTTLLAAVFRAPLDECHPTDYVIWLHGLTGSRKSAIAAIPQAFFGKFTDRSFPANWSDSVNDSEMKAHQAKDAVFVIDDFKPSVSPMEASKLYGAAERFIRNTGNRAGRGRRDSNMQAKAAPYNRSMTLSTAEELPRGPSLLGRLLILELTRSDVDNAVLTQLQEAVDRGSYSGLMASYLQWLAPRIDDLKKNLSVLVKQERNKAIQNGFASSHPRAPEIYANLVVGSITFLTFFKEAGIIDNDQRSALMMAIEKNLRQVFTEQGAYLSEQDETERFLQILRSVLSSGQGHISDRLDQGPPKSRPFSWGWREDKKDIVGDRNYKPMGDCMGWYAIGSSNNPDELWLQQETVFKSVQQFARAQGDAFLLQPSTLWRRMLDRGLIVHTEVDAYNKTTKTTVKRVVAGRKIRVMVLSAELIESG